MAKDLICFLDAVQKGFMRHGSSAWNMMKQREVVLTVVLKHNLQLRI